MHMVEFFTLRQTRQLQRTLELDTQCTTLAVQRFRLQRAEQEQQRRQQQEQTLGFPAHRYTAARYPAPPVSLSITGATKPTS